MLAYQAGRQGWNWPQDFWALYCPDCGAPNVRLHFTREAELVRAQVDLADGVDGDELAYRLLGRDICLFGGVSAFQYQMSI